MWSFTQSGPVRQVKDALKATYVDNPLAQPEQALRQKVENMLTEVQKIRDDFPINLSASGSQTMDGNTVTDVTLNVSITTVV